MLSSSSRNMVRNMVRVVRPASSLVQKFDEATTAIPMKSAAKYTAKNMAWTAGELKVRVAMLIGRCCIMLRCVTTHAFGYASKLLHVFMSPFPQKSPVISGSFAERDLQLKASYASLIPCCKFLKVNETIVSPL